MENSLKIISQNLWLHPHNLEQRMQNFLNQTFPDKNEETNSYIKNSKNENNNNNDNSNKIENKPKNKNKKIKPTYPDILAIQELFSPVLKKTFTEKLEKLGYAVFHPNYIQHDYKLYAYLPSLVFFFTAAVFEIIIFKILFYIISALFLPQVFKYLSIKFLIIPQDPYNKIVKQPNCNYDFMSELLALSTDEFENFEVLTAKPFDTVGYPFPQYPSNKQKPKKYQCNEIMLFVEFVRNLIFFYIQMVFMKPGYILVSCTHKKTKKNFIIGDCHCVISFKNPRRMYQVMELNKKIEYYQNLKKIDHVIISGDFNSFPDYIDMQFLKQQNFVDTFQIYENNNKKLADNQKYTWHNKNPNTQVQDHLEKDAKIDFTFYKNFCSKNPLKTENSFIINNEPETIVSDHYGIYSELSFQE